MADAERRRRKRVFAEAKVKLSSIKTDLASLSTEYSDYVDWDDADDVEVEIAMGNIKSWKTNFMRCRRDLADLDGVVQGEELAELTEDLGRLQELLRKTDVELENTVRAVREADREKGLFSDRKSKPDPVQLPTFSGQAGEDFIVFKEKFLKACINNQIPKSDQVDKLREVLKGKARSQVPDHTEIMERAWELLNSVFGDPMTLLRN